MRNAERTPLILNSVFRIPYSAFRIRSLQRRADASPTEPDARAIRLINTISFLDQSMLHSKTQLEEQLFINLTPMIDVIVTLLVFFMAATKLYDWDEDKLDVSVPQVASAQPLTSLPDDLNLSVSSDGQIALNGEVCALSELQPRLQAARTNFAEQGVVIRADGRVPHQRVADVMSACNAAGITRLSISVRETGAE